MTTRPKNIPCAVARKCGACSHIAVPYEQQLAAKDAHMRELFEGFGGMSVKPIVGMDDPFHYRNKVTSPFAPGKRMPKGKREILTGMYASGSHRIVQTDSCLIENERAQLVIRAIRQIMMRHGIEPYDEDRGKGFLRHVVVRVGHESDEVLVTLVTNSAEFPASKSFCRELVKKCPFVTSIVQNINLRKTNVILGQDERRLYGPGFILDTLCGLSFRISSQSFYQVNAVQTAVLYELAICASRGVAFDDAAVGDTSAGVDAGPVVVDAYCGTGTIGLVAAKRFAGRVIGVDSVEAAVRDARENARHNGIDNAQFVAADAGDFMRELAAGGERVDAVFLDPPRAGSTPEFLEALAALAPKRVVYISCNPETQVRDLRLLSDLGFHAAEVQPVDMFPHTDHVETVARVERTGGR